MNQMQVREYVEKYLAAFSSHIVETHPDYLTVKLPVEVDKDIGNRPFYWSWVEKMNLPYQPMVLTFCFHPDRMPSDRRVEHLHLGAARLQQIFQSTRKHGSFVCMYETQPPGQTRPLSRRSAPLVPWLGVNWKISFICDKKRDLILHFGVNLHQPQLVREFYPFLLERPLAPAIPDYHYTLDRRMTIPEAFAMMEAEIHRILAQEDQRWAEEAGQRLEEELQILEDYYRELEAREAGESTEQHEASPLAERSEEMSEEQELQLEQPQGQQAEQPQGQQAEQPRGQREAKPVEEPQPPAWGPPPPMGAARDEPPLPTLEEHLSSGGKILDFLRANSFQETPKEKIQLDEWKASTPGEEKQRRMDEMRWQYEPRIAVQFINGGLFYLQSDPASAMALPSRRKL